MLHQLLNCNKATALVTRSTGKNSATPHKTRKKYRKNSGAGNLSGRSKVFALPLLMLVLLSSTSIAVLGQAVSSSWTLTSNGNASVSGNITATTIAKGSDVGNLTYGAQGTVAKDWNSNEINAEDYYMFSVSPAAGYALSINSISFSRRVSGSTMSGAVYYSTDNFATYTQLGTDFNVTTTHTAWSNTPSISVPAGGTLSIAILGWSASNSNRNYHIKSMVISGNALAQVPNAPVLSSATSSSMNVAIGADNNASAIEYVIKESGGQFVQADGSLGASEIWKTAAAWGTKTISGLTSSTGYSFSSKARSSAGFETDYGASASLSTLPPDLSAGDIVIIAFGPTTTDKFAFVLLKDIAAGTVINFTDNGFASATTGR
ncbi:MAG: hypothetical protein IT223_04180, partial [Crocinitomicaceae bacterium]|nr:hypothetical protein [Crocinitomicaceae bacterium]